MSAFTPLLGGKRTSARPWTVSRKYQRAKKPYWAEYYCNEGSQQVLIGKENDMVNAEGFPDAGAQGPAAARPAEVQCAAR